jgi:hypothetical protein
MKTVISNAKAFFTSMGGLHDADIRQIVWNALARSLSLEIDDLNANSLGFPEYPGAEPSTFVFYGAEGLTFSCDAFADDIQRVYDVEIEEMGGGKLRCTLLISPGGRFTFGFSSVNLERHQ